MRTVLVLSIAVTALSLASCSKKIDSETAAPSTSASASAGSLAAAAAPGRANSAEIGGHVAKVGDYAVELRLFANGFADAVVRDAAGLALADTAKAKLSVRANAAGDAHPNIDLAFEPVLGRFAARAGAQGTAAVALVPGPVDLELQIGDAISKGRLEAAVLLVGPEIGGTLVVAGKYGVELLARANGEVEAIVRDAGGVRLDFDSGLKIDVKLAVSGAEAHKVTLAWNAPKARFTGRADAAFKLSGGPAELSINAEVAARLPSLALQAEAKHGGRVLAFSEYSVELVAKADVVTAFVFDASGNAVAKGDLELSLRAAAGAFVNMQWDPPSLSYRAKLDAKVDLDTTPLVLGLRAAGKAFVAVSMPRIQLDAKANAGAKLDAKVDLDPKAKIDAKAGAGAGAKAGINVKPPEVKASKTVNAGAGATPAAGASAKAGFSFGTR